MKNTQESKPQPGGRTTARRPNLDEKSQAAFWPLFDQRNAVMERQGEIANMMIAAAHRKDQAAYESHRDQHETLQLEIEALSRQMAQYEHQVNAG